MPEIDEDAFVMPDAWRAHLHPCRGGAPGPPVEPDPGAAEAVRGFTEEARDALHHLLDAEQSHRDLVESARAHLDGAPDPRGAGVIAAVVAAESGMIDDIFASVDRLGATWKFADAWIAEHGLGFAAAATAELGRVIVDGYTYRGRQPWRHLRAYRPGEEEPPVDKVRHCLHLVAKRVRASLAAAGERDYREAVEALAHCRRDGAQRLIASYLAPTRLDWSDELCASLPGEPSHGELMLLLPAIGSLEQLELLERLDHVDLSPRTWTPDPLYTVVEAVGSAMAPRIAAAYDDGDHFIAQQAQVLAALPTDEAFGLLLARLDKPQMHAAVQEAARRFPARALRLLGDAAVQRTASYATRLLRRHVRAHPALTAALLPGLPADVRRAVETAGEGWAEEAPPEALPLLLADPPWTREGVHVKFMIVRGLKAPNEPETAWEPGEWEEWSSSQNVMKRVIANDGTDALPAALELALSEPATATELLLPLCDARVAALMAESLDRRPWLHPVVEGWFQRHAFAAARALIPAALGKAGRQRREAEAALRFLASNGHRDDVTDAARAHRSKAAAALEALLATNVLNVLPETMPEIDPFVDPHLLPQVFLRDGRGALPGEAAGHIITMLALSKPDHAYPGIDVVKETCDPASLAAFAWGLFEQYGFAGRSGGPGDDAWVLNALGLLGDNDTVRRLAPLIRTWPGAGGHHLAVAGLDALVAIGTDIALTHLNGIARNVRYKGLKAKAQQRIAALAADRGLSPERLVRDLGLDGTGPRRFTVGLDERLKP
ncbi:hypothetical protein [Actinomadura rugatobispora]|uniref:HEAT repeat domain-containing protein n=1 Tax=Actinomadura rugatobispora TaxID=1994 RepID=A0ABW1A3X0_9ACTN|nr:hypothetical protein GCM10010200_049260 [Actinomadura rugatobispora]